MRTQKVKRKTKTHRKKNVRSKRVKKTRIKKSRVKRKSVKKSKLKQISRGGKYLVKRSKRNRRLSGGSIEQGVQSLENYELRGAQQSVDELKLLYNAGGADGRLGSPTLKSVQDAHDHLAEMKVAVNQQREAREIAADAEKGRLAEAHRLLREASIPESEMVWEEVRDNNKWDRVKTKAASAKTKAASAKTKAASAKTKVRNKIQELLGNAQQELDEPLAVDEVPSPD